MAFLALTVSGKRSGKQDYSILFVFHLRLDQVTDGGWAGNFSFLLAAQLFHSLLFFSLVLRFDGQADVAVLTIHADDARFDFFAFFQDVGRVFNAVNTDFRCFQGSHHVFSQLNSSGLSSDFLDYTLNDRTFLVDASVSIERIFRHLLDAQGDALTLSVDCQNDSFYFFALTVLTYSFFASFVPGDVRQVYQTINATVQTDKDTEVSDGLDLTGDTVALVEVTRRTLPMG